MGLTEKHGGSVSEGLAWWWRVAAETGGGCDYM